MAISGSNPMGILVYHDNKRTSGRLEVNGIQSTSKGSPFGEVINLSANGLLIMRRKRIRFEEHDRFSVQLTGNESELDVYVKIAWEKRIGFRKWLYGLSFSALIERDQMIIKKMAMQATPNHKTQPSPLKVA